MIPGTPVLLGVAGYDDDDDEFKAVPAALEAAMQRSTITTSAPTSRSQ
jgi:hypothetical protein